MAGAEVDVRKRASDMSNQKCYFILVDGERLIIDDGLINGEHAKFYCAIDLSSMDEIKTRKVKRPLAEDIEISDVPDKKWPTHFSGRSRKDVQRREALMGFRESDSESSTTAYSKSSSDRLVIDEEQIRSDVSEVGSERNMDDNTDSMELPYEPSNRSIQHIDETVKFDVDFSTFRVVKRWMDRVENRDYFDSKFSFDTRVGDPNHIRNVLCALNPRVLLEKVAYSSYENKENTMAETPVDDISKETSIRDSSIDETNESLKILQDIPLLSNSKKFKSSIKLLPKSYRPEEDKMILEWVLRNNNAVKVNGTDVWKRLETENIMPYVRSWQSLRNRFLKSILYNLRSYGLSNEEERRLVIGAEKGIMKKSFQNKSPKQNDAKQLGKNQKSNDPYSKDFVKGDGNINLSFQEYKRNSLPSTISKSPKQEDVRKRKLFTRGSYVSSVNSK